MAIPRRPLERDPDAPIRTRRFIDQAADILDSLIMQGVIQQTGGGPGGKWTINTNVLNVISGGLALGVGDPDQGEQGWPGPAGAVGRTGSTGSPGMMGQDGDDGPMGPIGLPGAAGAAGVAGASGSMGPPGMDGQDAADFAGPISDSVGQKAYQNIANTFVAGNTFTVAPSSPFNGVSKTERWGVNTANSTASGDRNTIVGANAFSAATSADGNVVLGADALTSNFTTQRFSVVIGCAVIYGSAGNGGFDVIIGGNARRNAGGGDFGCTSIGYANTIGGTNAIIIGYNMTNQVTKAITIGVSHSVSGSIQSDIAIGDSHTITHSGCVFLGDHGVSDRAGVMNFTQAAAMPTYFAIGGISSTTFDRKVFLQKAEWISNTDASRTTRNRFFSGDANGSDGGISGDGFECLRFETDGVRGNTSVPATLTATKLAKLGGTIFDHAVDAGNGTTVETDLYTDTIPANCLSENNDKLQAVYGGVFVSSATATREIKVYFAGSVVFDSGALTLSLSAAWYVNVTIIRVSATMVRCIVAMTTEGAALAAYTSYTELTGLTLSGANILKITGQAGGVGAATNDIVAKMGSVGWKPAA